MIDVATTSPSSPHPTLARMNQDQNDDAFIDFSPFSPWKYLQYIGLRGTTTMRK
jgi:hypothetical protein